VISPEGCASILWRSGEQAKEAAEALKITAQDLLALGVIDQIIAEPLGGAHRSRETVFAAVADSLDRALRDLAPLDGPTLRRKRREKFLDMGKTGLA
jgi:acetyl-CoA carboxylase carboxyl transferase subunit alpha